MNGRNLAQRILFGLLIAGSLSAFAWLPLPIGSLGQSDFLPYWTAAYVFVRGGDAYSTPALDEAFRTQRPTQYAATDPIYRPPWALGPPWAVLLLAPLGWLPFEVAARLWLMLTLALISGAAIGTWHSLGGAARGRPWWAVLLALCFVPALIVITLGQIVALVLAGLVASVTALQVRRDGVAGAALLLALIKPQLMFLAVPAVLLWALWRGRWRVWAGLAVSLLMAIAVFTLLAPNGLAGYVNYARSYDFSRHASATIGGVVRAYGNTDALRWIGVAALPVLPWLARAIDRDGIWTGVNAALLIALPSAPYGWNYDQIVLIPAIVQAALWLRDSRGRRRAWLIAALATIYAALWAMRLRGAGEMLYVWVPLVIGAWYATVHRRGPA